MEEDTSDKSMMAAEPEGHVLLTNIVVAAYTDATQTKRKYFADPPTQQPTITNTIDIYSVARIVIDRHGEDATLHRSLAQTRLE